MLVGDKYKIESDSYNVILLRKAVSKKTGAVRWKQTNFFGSIKDALVFLVELEVRETDLTDLKTVSEKLDEVLAVVRSLQIG